MASLPSMKKASIHSDQARWIVMASEGLEHKQAPILYEGEVIFKVDHRLQSLIQFYVDHGILTCNSCQDNVGETTWIE